MSRRQPPVVLKRECGSEHSPMRKWRAPHTVIHERSEEPALSQPKGSGLPADTLIDRSVQALTARFFADAQHDIKVLSTTGKRSERQSC